MTMGFVDARRPAGRLLRGMAAALLALALGPLSSGTQARVPSTLKVSEDGQVVPLQALTGVYPAAGPSGTGRDELVRWELKRAYRNRILAMVCFCMLLVPSYMVPILASR